MRRRILGLFLLACASACATGGEGEAAANGAGGAAGHAGHGGGASTGGTGPGGAGGAGGSESACGNGVAEPGEACDGLDSGGKTCESYGLGPGRLTCNAFCQVVVTACAPPP